MTDGQMHDVIVADADRNNANVAAISLVISTLGRTDKLARLLASLQAQTFRNYEIIVVDQNPKGYLEDVLAPYRDDQRLRHLRSPKGVSHGRNVGIANAEAAIIGFPDDDCWYAPDVLEKMVSLFARNPETGIVIGRTVDEAGMNSIVPALSRDCRIGKRDVLYVGNANALFFRREALASIGPYDEKLGPGPATIFQSAEDLDIVARALALNLRVDFFTSLTIFHEQVDTGAGDTYLKRIRTYSLGTGAFFRKNGYSPLTVAALLLRTLAGIPLRLVRGQPLELRPKLAYAYNIAAGYLLWPGSR
ncbi:glycosyltransferase family 2 protein [Rhizobiaceae bacterium n13]|uniref:Glycosyltransferase family 2 protein n=1 Tax=Ferirhizobium litorale TaxID=2927786 RepID=A0AAE3U096_9HYPH|nr:glycosyltransferase family A protein [Fererhizobium litorale]MDI7861824.1 glycosyltransferase family 2 protein [Fererhizobium litorale]MDI7921834.1 glycosyltransferase family 2 protein [Fererhizobium litorale]